MQERCTDSLFLGLGSSSDSSGSNELQQKLIYIPGIQMFQHLECDGLQTAVSMLAFNTIRKLLSFYCPFPQFWRVF